MNKPPPLPPRVSKPPSFASMKKQQEIGMYNKAISTQSQQRYNNRKINVRRKTLLESLKNTNYKSKQKKLGLGPNLAKLNAQMESQYQMGRGYTKIQKYKEQKRKNLKNKLYIFYIIFTFKILITKY